MLPDGDRTRSICVRGFLGAHPGPHFQSVSLGELGDQVGEPGDRVSYGRQGHPQVAVRQHESPVHPKLPVVVRSTAACQSG